ncbi:carboxypeptidase B-like [Amphibalanus amphitrite]|uniref:carboxypeptidase B-like n=1 Tax=Amphibalanus amphitrite TaxID=1232801 RepID=UPI001C8FDB32|nr:carboxypeptidase B-like [Amphibalanus amphitrite]
MARSRPPRSPPLVPALALVLALTASPIAARVHVQSLPADAGRPAGQGVGGEDYQGHQVLKVFVADNGTLDLLRSFEGNPDVDFWTPASGLNPTVDVLVAPDVGRRLKEELTRSGASYTVNIEDVQAAVEEESPVMSDTERELLVGRSGHPLTWTAYHSADDHHQYMDFIEQNYKGLCETFSIGTSTEGRDLRGVKCGLGKREVWIDGGIHAREWVSPAVVSCLIREYSQRSVNHQDLLRKHTIYMLPILNPDGYEYTRSGGRRRRFWRKTRSRNPGSSCIGADPNRNFDAHWGETGSSMDPCSDIYAGSRPFSEPETRALRDFLLGRVHAMKMYISFHSYSQMLFVPYAFSKERPADYKELLRVAKAGEKAIRRTSGKAYRVGQASQLLYEAAGGSDDWAKSKAGIKYSFTFELRDKGRQGFLLSASQIEDTCTEIVAAVDTMITTSAEQDDKA